MIEQTRRAVSRRKLMFGAVAMGVVLAGLATGGYYLVVADARCTLERTYREESIYPSFPPSRRVKFAPGYNLHGIEYAFGVVPDETVQVRLTMRNTTDAPISFSSGGVEFFVDVVEVDACEGIWFGPRNSDAALWGHELGPGEEKTYLMEWERVDMQDEAVSPGRYLVYGSKHISGRTSNGALWFSYVSPPIELNLD